MRQEHLRYLFVTFSFTFVLTAALFELADTVFTVVV